MNIFLEEEYLSGLKDAVSSGKTVRIVFGKKTYCDIQKNSEVKQIYEAVLMMLDVSIRFNPDVPENTEQIINEREDIWERDRKTEICSIEHSCSKALEEKEKFDEYFENGIPLKDLNNPLETLMELYKSKNQN